MRRTIKGEQAEQAMSEMSAARNCLLQELDHIFDDAKQMSCTRLSLAIEVLIDAKIKWRQRS